MVLDCLLKLSLCAWWWHSRHKFQYCLPLSSYQRRYHQPNRKGCCWPNVGFTVFGLDLKSWSQLENRDVFMMLAEWKNKLKTADPTGRRASNASPWTGTPTNPPFFFLLPHKVHSWKRFDCLGWVTRLSICVLPLHGFLKGGMDIIEPATSGGICHWNHHCELIWVLVIALVLLLSGPTWCCWRDLSS